MNARQLGFQARTFARSGYTGRILEEEVLGHCLVNWNGQMYFEFEPSMRIARASQPFDPMGPDPKKHPIARKFHDLVAWEMRIEPRALRIYTAVGSPLDKFHSVDGWFEHEGKAVTFDLTLNSQKERYKADVVVIMHHAEDDLTFGARSVANMLWTTNRRVR